MSFNNPTYLTGDLNADHRFLGNRSNNNAGRGLQRMHDNNKITHLGPYFSTYTSGNKKGTPGIVLDNNNIFHNIIITQGPVTSSDHLTIVVTITTKAIKISTRPRFIYNKANW